MKLGFLREWMSLLQTNNDEEEGDENDDTKTKSFTPTKRLCERDYIILDMLNSTPESVSFCITDPHQSDNPVIYISSGFTRLTGYQFDDIVGRNCRFLQGKETSPQDVKRISDALKSEKECSVNLLNYKKDGTKFVNEVRSMLYIAVKSLELWLSILIVLYLFMCYRSIITCAFFSTNRSLSIRAGSI